MGLKTIQDIISIISGLLTIITMISNLRKKSLLQETIKSSPQIILCI